MSNVLKPEKQEQIRGITPGRFLSSHRWGPDQVIVAAVAKLKAVAQALVP
jgi:hypothetical protein